MGLLSVALCTLLLTIGCSHNSKHKTQDTRHKRAELQVETFYLDYLNSLFAENSVTQKKNIGVFFKRHTEEVG